MKKKVLAITLVFTIFVTMLLTSCNSQKSVSSDEIRIGVTVYDEYDAFIALLMEEFMKDVAKYNKTSEKQITVMKYNGAGNQSKQNYQVAEMIEKGCNVILVNLVDRTDASTIIESARQANIPVVFFNRELVPEDLMSWNKLYYVGGDASESGVLQGKIASDAIKSNPSIDRNGDGKIQYVVIEGEAGHQDAIVRSESSVNTLIENGIDLDKLESAIANWKRTQAQTKMNSMLGKYGTEIELVLANNDEMALGCIDEYQSNNISSDDRPLIVGIDGTNVGLEAVLNDQMYGTVYNDKEGQAEAMLELSVKVASGSDISDLNMENGKYIRLPYDIVTKDNIEKYITHDVEE